MSEGKKSPLHTKILIGMLFGVVAGLAVKQIGLDQSTIDTIIKWVEPIGQIFLRMVFMTVIPLVFSALVLGIAEIGDLKRVGKIGVRLLLYSLVVSTISVFIGIALVNMFEPGNSLTPETRDYLTSEFQEKSAVANQNAEIATERTVGDIVTNIVPKNPLEDMVRAFDTGYTGGGLLAVMFFALIFGIAMASVESEKTVVLKSFFEG